MSQGFIIWNRTPNPEVSLYFNHRFNSWEGIFYLTLKNISIEFVIVYHPHCMSNHTVKSTRLTGPDKVQFCSQVVWAFSGIKGLCIHRVTYFAEKKFFLPENSYNLRVICYHSQMTWSKSTNTKENMYNVTISLRAIQPSVCPHCYFWLISKQNSLELPLPRDCYSSHTQSCKQFWPM